ncbi:MAG: hypothetical protein N838_27075 [Thiohalocapsa sp. PB-PSB1]|nr:MAG: hypothetical protein N838_10980 [Thiohalocapsa sp. PB-PSB1]QQO56481.1 MAG: hypothetical protein N838_27075 [Thiohalocapsa sp. PB-PSB1]HCS91006.1 hypothetical protein [Chromatiaceae bacterium]
MATNPRPVIKTIALAALLAAPSVQALGFGDMFNPGRWFGGDNYNDDYYYDAPYGGPYLGGPYGAPGYGGYGVPGYGYGGIPYGYGGYGGYAPGAVPGYTAPAMTAPAVSAPAAGSNDAKDQEIEALKRRIDQLESRQNTSRPAPGGDTWPAAPAFRPMDQY